MPLLSSAIRIGQIAYRYGKTAGKFTSGETAFISRFPPPYRDTVRTILKGAQTVTYGGLVADILKGQIGTDQGNGIPKKVRDLSRGRYQKRYRQKFYNSRYNKYGSRNRRPCCKFCKPRYRQRSY